MAAPPGAEPGGRDDEATSSGAVASQATSSEVLAAGLGYIADGRAVFLTTPGLGQYANCVPCEEQHGSPAAKERCEHLFCHSFYAATKDPEQFERMVLLRPDSGLAVRTGAPSGVVVLDVDMKNGHDGLGSLRQLAEQRPEIRRTRGPAQWVPFSRCDDCAERYEHAVRIAGGPTARCRR